MQTRTHEPPTATVVLFLLIAIGWLLGGCLSTNPARAGRTISHWVPVGTSEDAADTIMKQHRFDFEHLDLDGHGRRDFYFVRVGIVHNWLVMIHEQNGKVATTNFPVTVIFTLFEWST